MAGFLSNCEPTSTSPGAAFPSSYSRPEWLFSQEQLEELLSTFKVQLSDLRTNKNNSELVEKVLGVTLTHRRNENGFILAGYKADCGNMVGLQYEPDTYELLLARLHLAIDIQSILFDWCSRGLDETKKESFLGRSMNAVSSVVADEPQELGILRSRSTSQSSISNMSVMSTNTVMTTPPSSVMVTDYERGSKRRNLGNGEHINHVPRPPRLSLVTTEPLVPSALTSAYPYEDSASTASPSGKRKWMDTAIFSGSGYAVTPSSAAFSPHTNSPGCFGPLGKSLISPSTPSSEKMFFMCPFHIMDPQNERHKGCAGRPYPNPRKLKEHVWRFTRPFHCPRCGEGFGRDKTRAIHLEKKNPCQPRPATEQYEGSREHLRDKKIETAKSTQEIINVLREYGWGSDISGNNTIEGSDNGNITQSIISFQDPFSGCNERQDQHVQTHNPSYLHGLNLDLGFDENVPKIVVQSYDIHQAMATAVSAQQCGNYRGKILEGEGWKPMTLPGTQQPITPPMDQGHPTPEAKHGTLSPPSRRQRDTQPAHAGAATANPIGTTGLSMASPKSPTPELTHNGPSPMPSPNMSTQDFDEREQEHVIFESPLTTPSININYWQLKNQSSVCDASLEEVEEHGSGCSGRGMSIGGTSMSMGWQRRPSPGSFDQLAFSLLEDIEHSWENYPYNY